MFSSTTMELSTIIPTANTMPISEMMLMLMSTTPRDRRAYMPANVNTTQMGIEMDRMNVLRTFQRNRNMITSASRPPYMPPSLRSEMVPRISSDESRNTRYSSPVSSGNLCNCSSSAVTDWHTSTTLAVEALKIRTVTASWPLKW